MKLTNLAMSAMVFVALCGCDTNKTAPPGGDPNTQAAEPSTMGAVVRSAENTPNRCSEISTRDWVASINEFPGPDKPVSPLVVNGMAHITSGGWTISLADRGQTKDIPYTQMLELIATKSGDVSTQPDGDIKVTPFTKAAPGQVGTVVIKCSEREVANLKVDRPRK